MAAKAETNPQMALSLYAEARENLLEAIATALKNDAWVVALWLTGSLGRGKGDDVSDIDITVVLNDEAAEALCQRPSQVGGLIPPERLAFFSHFGRPALIHENHNNAPAGGTFSFVQYAETALMVDWILIPQSKAERPSDSLLLFDKAEIPLQPTAEPLETAERARIASDKAVFFWMMAAVIVKYIARKDTLLFNSWLDELHWSVNDIDGIVHDKEPVMDYKKRLPLALTAEEQKKALRGVCQRMLTLQSHISELGGYVLDDPVSAVEKRLALV